MTKLTRYAAIFLLVAVSSIISNWIIDPSHLTRLLSGLGLHIPIDSLPKKSFGLAPWGFMSEDPLLTLLSNRSYMI